MSFLPATFANSPENIITIHYLMPHREETYSYDKVGNRLAQSITQKGTETRSSQYGENKVLLMHNGKTGYVYDILGNLIEKGSDYTYNEVTQTSTVQPSTQDYRRYHYDLFGRMKEVWGVDPETQSLVLLAEYVYDFRGMRIAKIKDGHITRYHLDEEGRNLETETTDESVTTAWIGQKPLGYTDNEGTYWYISDHQGSTFMLTDGEGNILWEDAVNPFGITAGSRGSQDSQVLYTGKIFDADADLYYFNARWYDPETGRFASEDPARDGVNWYAYVGNNPLKYTDPTGLWRTREERKARRAERKSKRKERRNKRQNKKSSSNNNDSNKNSSNKGGSDNNSSNRNDSKGEESKGNTDPDQPDVGIDTGDNRELIDLPNVGSEDSKEAFEDSTGDVLDEVEIYNNYIDDRQLINKYMPGFLGIEGGGLIGGGIIVSGSYEVEPNSDSTYSLNIVAVGETAASALGVVEMTGRIEIEKNGKTVHEETLVRPDEPYMISQGSIMIGEASVRLPPQEQKIDFSVKLHISLGVRTPGGTAGTSGSVNIDIFE